MLPLAENDFIVYIGAVVKDNRHIQSIPRDISTQAQTKINEAKTLLPPYIVALTPSERHGLPKIGEKIISFVEKVHDFTRQKLNLVPPYLDMAAFGPDFKDEHGFWTLINSILQLEENADDTKTTAGSDTYQAAFVFYKSVKAEAAQDVSGVKAIHEKLGVVYA
jgi:hypothetical protein